MGGRPGECADLVRDLCLFADRIHASAEADDMLVTLLPGESTTITVSGFPSADETLTRAPVLRCVNDDAALRAGS